MCCAKYWDKFFIINNDIRICVFYFIDNKLINTFWRQLTPAIGYSLGETFAAYEIRHNIIYEVQILIQTIQIDTFLQYYINWINFLKMSQNHTYFFHLYNMSTLIQLTAATLYAQIKAEIGNIETFAAKPSNIVFCNITSSTSNPQSIGYNSIKIWCVYKSNWTSNGCWSGSCIKAHRKVSRCSNWIICNKSLQWTC